MSHSLPSCLLPYNAWLATLNKHAVDLFGQPINDCDIIDRQQIAIPSLTSGIEVPIKTERRP